MNYVIVKDKQFVLLGPMPWRQRMFQREINDLVDQGEISTQYVIPPVAPESNYMDLGEGLEIFPVMETITPNYELFYEQLAGPYYTYSNNQAFASYDAVAVPLEVTKGFIKNIVTDNRYKKEQAGIKLTIQGHEVTIDTARGSRDIFLQTYATMGDSETINWKFPEIWINVSKSDLGTIVNAGKNHIQSCFDWELSTHNEIDVASTVQELKAINLE